MSNIIESQERNMEEIENKRKGPFYIIGLVSGILAIACCFASLGLSVSNNYVSIYLLSTALALLGLNRIGFHVSNIRENMFENLFMTALTFALAFLVGFTKYGIYFLISSFFIYCCTIIVARLLKIKEDHSTQSIVFNVLSIVFSFLMSFVFFFPEIYAKHATSVSNSNFIVMCFAIMIIVSSGKNLIFPYHKELKIHTITKVIRRSLVYEIILSLLILIILCSIYFTIVEPMMTSYVDSLWYSFAVVTTIGFGELYVTTTFGRILSVILGISGIVVVALFTSVIVNFYNEMNKKREEKEMQDLIAKVEEIKHKEEIEQKENEN